MKELQTERLLLRRFIPEDWRDLHEYLSDPEVVRYEPYEPFSEPASRQEAASRAAQPCFIAVCLRDGGKLIGNVYFQRGEPEEFGTWELGYVFNRAHQGHGYATEACRAVLAHAFGELGARRVVAMCNPLNAASWRLLERLGMRREGHLRSNIYFKKDAAGNPLWCDTYEYALLADEWVAAQAE